MAMLSMGESRWRMVRRVLRRKRFGYADCRNQTRHDKVHFEWLVGNGFFAAVGDDQYEVTAKGKAAADLGFYDWQPTANGRPKG